MVLGQHAEDEAVRFLVEVAGLEACQAALEALRSHQHCAEDGDLDVDRRRDALDQIGHPQRLAPAPAMRRVMPGFSINFAASRCNPRASCTISWSVIADG